MVRGPIIANGASGVGRERLALADTKSFADLDMARFERFAEEVAHALRPRARTVRSTRGALSRGVGHAQGPADPDELGGLIEALFKTAPTSRKWPSKA